MLVSALQGTSGWISAALTAVMAVGWGRGVRENVVSLQSAASWRGGLI